MKKLVSIILAVLILASVAIIPAFAQENSKIMPDLAEVLKTKDSDDMVDIYVWTNYYGPNATQMPSWPDIGAARKELDEHYDNWFNEEIDAVVFKDIPYEEISIFSGVIIVSVRAGDIEKIVEHDIIREVSYFENHVLENEATTPYYLKQLFKHYPSTEEAYGYDELFYEEVGEVDIDCDDAMDYAVIYAHFAIAPDAIDSGVIGDRFFWTPQLYTPFRFGYAIYDIENDKFIPVNEGMLTEYPFASDIFDLLCVGSPFGDADCDNDLTVMDATTIQRCLAQLETFTNKEYLLKYGNYPTDFRSDINLDGSVNVLDATEIQLRLISAPDMNF